MDTRQPRTPILSDRLIYRGKEGRHTLRAAIVTADIGSLDPAGVTAGDVPALTDQWHVHLWVFTPSDKGGFAEYNVPHSDLSGGGELLPGHWCWIFEDPFADVEGD